MANTYTLINSTVLTGTQATVTFSSIPATYNDLVVQISARSTGSSSNDYLRYTLNSDTGTNYSGTMLMGNGSSATSSRDTSVSPTTANRVLYIDSSISTSNTFSNGEIYIPSYTASQYKPISQFGAMEDNSSTAWIQAIASLWTNTATVNSIKFETYSGSTSFVSGSSFWLYGIKNS